MWSGPRNISTAMMRAWENRGDTFVCDEPLYAHYLRTTGLPHPLADDIIARYETDWRKVVDQLTGEVPDGKAIFYQKHMTHHLLPDIDRGWLARVTNCFLIRDPREVINSYVKKNNDPVLEDVGFVQQVEIFDWVKAHTGATPPVLDARDVLSQPREMLVRLCGAVGVPFTEAMLSWPPGLRASDGLWATHWYTEVEKTTSFQPARPKLDPVPPHLSGIYERCRECYERMYEFRL
jgi:hypothetical protein